LLKRIFLFRNKSSSYFEKLILICVKINDSMKIHYLLCILLSFIANSQIKFEKGYIITQSGQQKDVYIKNLDWLENPDTFIYKSGENDEQKTGQLINIKEFSVPSYFKFVKYTGKIDVSSNNMNDLSYLPNPIWEERTIFLNQLTSGKLKLYQYRNKNIEQYFYSTENGEIIPLVYKKYNPGGDTYKIAENTEYIDQLVSLTGEKPRKIKYEKSYLVDFFQQYNGEKNETKNNKLDFNLSFRMGVSFNKLNVDLHSFYQDVDFYDKTGYTIGLEAELVLPFNKNKWSIIAEPTYYRYKNESVSKDGTYKFATSFDMLDLEIGLRHYMFLSDKSKIFINAGIVTNIYMTKDALMTYTSLKPGYLNGGSYYDTKSTYLNFGIGYKYKNKFSGELKVSTSKELYERGYWSAKLSRVSFILGYNIF